MIDAKDARQLQKKGVPQEEHLGNARIRAEAAIKDMARRGYDSVNLAVSYLNQASFDELVKDLCAAGFTCDRCLWGEKQSSVIISWKQHP